tara:strand:+ start:433 stop:822 length:390 start_codon:yes stop_codon:yes gene_type:complete
MTDMTDITTTSTTTTTKTRSTETPEFSSNEAIKQTEQTEQAEQTEITGSIKQTKKKKTKKKKKNRCFFEGCNKKLSTIDKLMTCKCSHNYCKQHVSITNHNCKANFLALNREYLIKNNPVVMPSKFTAL